MFSSHSPVLTKDQRRLYASEELVNFRWICKIVATYSPYILTKADEIPKDTQDELAELGQFADIAYSTIPIQFLVKNIDTLSQPGFPLENYSVLQEVVVIDSFHGSCADLPVYIVYRPSTGQLIISIAGTSSAKQVFYDLAAMRIRHPSKEGSVHCGFWSLFLGIRSPALAGIRKGLAEHSPRELVLTGHSMGGSVAYLLFTDLLSDEKQPLPAHLKIAVFGCPRVGDAKFVAHFRSLLQTRRTRNGAGTLREYSIKAYNDGVPALPPARLGYRHFSQQPIFALHGKLYKVPSTECEHAMFHVQIDNNSEGSCSLFPKGGHNYYNGRNLEHFIRGISLLVKARPTIAGWEIRFTDILRRKS